MNLSQRHFVSLDPQIGGGGTYASIGARIWLPENKVGMIVDRGDDWPEDIQNQLEAYGQDMWLFRDDKSRATTRARNTYQNDLRGFQYLVPRVRLTPKDLIGTKLDRPKTLHFICSPSRAKVIMSEVAAHEDWSPITIYEPIPDRCIPEELPALQEVLPWISILSPNAEEALSLLSMPPKVTKSTVEEACAKFLGFGIGSNCTGTVIIRCGSLGAYVASRFERGSWIDAYWAQSDVDKVMDVTGAGNAFLGGLAAGLLFANGSVSDAALYASVSASFVIEQEGLPRLSICDPRNGSMKECWNGVDAESRLNELRERREARGNTHNLQHMLKSGLE